MAHLIESPVFVIVLLATLGCGFGAGAAERGASRAAGNRKAKIKLLDGKPKTIVVNGYSTSFKWPAVLQRKLDRYFGGKRVIEVRSATQGGTPIAKWMDAKTGKPLRPWTAKLLPKLKRKGNAPVVVLAQQSLQWAFGGRGAGIRSKTDKAHIREGADVLERYVRRLKADGADLVFVAMHIYKKPMEPVIGNERLALAELLKRRIAGVKAGPDVWTATEKLYPQAFAGDRVHPNAMGAEVMAQYWFETLLKHDGVKAPKWGREEMNAAIKNPPKEPADNRRRRRRR